MDRMCVKETLLQLAGQLCEDGQAELQEKVILSQIAELCNTRVSEIIKDEHGKPWMKRIHNIYIDDIFAYLTEYIAAHNIPLYGARFIFRNVSADARHIYLNKVNCPKQNLHNLDLIMSEEIKDKAWLRYIGADTELRSVSKQEYDKFLALKDSDENYPQCFLEATIKTLHMLDAREVEGVIPED